MFQLKLDNLLFFFLFIPCCNTSRLDTYLIETRKFASLNSLLQKFQPCQITLFAKRSSDIPFLVHSEQSIQIFVVQHTENSPFKKFTKLNSIDPIFFGLQYNYKFSTPVCKLNVVFWSLNEWKKPMQYFVSLLKHVEFSIALSKNLMFCSVYCRSKISNLVLIQKRIKPKSFFQMLRGLSYLVKISCFRFWTISLMPLDNEFMNPIIRIQSFLWHSWTNKFLRQRVIPKF